MQQSWQAVARFRADVYRLFGHCLLQPPHEDQAFLLQPDFWRDFPLAAANDTMTKALDDIVRITSGLAALPADAALQRLQVEYTDLFLGIGKPLAPPWESVYRSPARLMFGPAADEVRDAMTQYGLASAEGHRQPEDHLGLELMLLAAASQMAADGPDTDWRDSAERQQAFISSHPLGWIEDLERDATTHGATGFYGALIAAIRGVLLWDRDLLKEYVESAPAAVRTPD